MENKTAVGRIEHTVGKVEHVNAAHVIGVKHVYPNVNVVVIPCIIGAGEYVIDIGNFATARTGIGLGDLQHLGVHVTVILHTVGRVGGLGIGCGFGFFAKIGVNGRGVHKSRGIIKGYLFAKTGNVHIGAVRNNVGAADVSNGVKHKAHGAFCQGEAEFIRTGSVGAAAFFEFDRSGNTAYNLVAEIIFPTAAVGGVKGKGHIPRSVVAAGKIQQVVGTSVIGIVHVGPDVHVVGIPRVIRDGFNIVHVGS